MAHRDLNRLPTTVVPSHYDLELAPDLDGATFSGREEVTLVLTEPTDELVLHALDLELDEVWLEADGARIDATPTFDAATETVALALGATAPAGAATLHATFRGTLNDKLVGFYRSTFTADDGSTQTLACTQFESTHARRAFPCWDEPAFKATYAIRLVVDDGLLAVSNALETAVDPLPDGRKRVHFAPTMAMSTYLVAFVVGPLEATDVVDVDGVPLRVIAPPGIQSRASRRPTDHADDAHRGDPAVARRLGLRRAAVPGPHRRGTERKGRRRLTDKKFRKGDNVEWQSHGTTVTGTVEREITSDTEAAGRTVRASKDEPQYQVRSDKTGADAVHKPDALRRAK